MRKLLTVIFLLFATTAMAATDIVATYKYPDGNMVTIVTWWSPLTAFGISSLTGVAFGIYPAYQAARMHPVEALRHE